MKYSNVFAMAQQARSLLGAAVAALEGACTFFDLWNFSKWFSTIFRHSSLFLFLFLWMNWISQVFSLQETRTETVTALWKEKRKHIRLVSSAAPRLMPCVCCAVPRFASSPVHAVHPTQIVSVAHCIVWHDLLLKTNLYQNETTGGVSSNAKVQKNTSQDPNRDLKFPNASIFIQIWRMSAPVAANPAYSYSSGSTLANIDSSLQNGDPDRWNRDPQS